MTSVSGAGSFDGLYAASIVQTLREPLVLLDEQLRVVMANASFYATFGAAAGTLEGRPFRELEAGLWNIPALQPLLHDILPHDTTVRDFEIRQTAPVDRTLLLNARRLVHPDGRVRMILIDFEDVTERRRLQRVLETTVAELERSNHELESFASIASHDLQEPLRKITAFGERLEHACRTNMPENARDYLARMTGAATRMQRLINDLLTLSRVTVQESNLRDVSLSTIVAEVSGDLEEAISRAGGRVDCAPLPVVRADPTQMRQLFQNLIGNALKFRGAAPPVVRITATRLDVPLAPASHRDEQGAWRIDVADNGIGFDPKHAERIFRPFERLHARDAFDGTGIGLALCRRIVQHHGGTIRAESEPGTGSRFIVHLPSRHKEQS